MTGVDSRQVDAIAEKFSELVRLALGTDIDDVIRRNREEPDGSTCASHDFCDAQLLMAWAFDEVLDRGCYPDSETDAELWRAAWKRAQTTGFGTLPDAGPAREAAAPQPSNRERQQA